MSEFFYPNDCFVCKSTSTLRRCSCCRLIYYCGEAHQKKDWKNHKEFCSIICKIAKSKGFTHIYQDLRGCSSEKWTNARNDMVILVMTFIHRDLRQYEIDMLQYPRSCIVCYDTNANNLINCPGCPLVSFCKDHPDTSQHDKVCPDFALNYNLEKKFKDDPRLPALGMHTIMSEIRKEKFELPSSISEFLDQELETFLNLDESIKVYISLFYCQRLTVLNIFNKLNYVPSSKLTIHFSRSHKKHFASKSWEILFHLLPNLNQLTLIVTECSKESNEELELCEQCSLKKRKLIVNTLPVGYTDYVAKSNYEVPDLIIFENLLPLKWGDENYASWQAKTDMWPNLRCPVAFMTDTDKKTIRLKKTFNSSFWKPLICFEGLNEFASLYSRRDSNEWELAKLCQFLIVTKAPSSSDRPYKSIDSQLVVKKASKTVNEGYTMNTNSFNSGVCHVCKTLNASVACKRCRMVFYCGTEHAKIDWMSHKELCTAISGLLSKKRTSYLLGNLKSADDETWLEARFAVMREVEQKLRRPLLRFETNIFLFPRSCIVCHESNLSEIEICQCGVSLCKLHRDDSRHQSLCKEFDLELKLTIYDLPQFSTATMPCSKEGVSLPPSIAQFVQSYITIIPKSSKPFLKGSDKILVSDHFCRPMTLIYTLKKLKYSVPKTMVVHVIGVNNDEIHPDYWKFVLDWLQNLKSMQIIFVGMELEERQVSSINPMGFIYSTFKQWEELDCKMIRGSYDEYFESGDFLKPDIVMSFNMEIRDCRLTCSECSLSKTLSIIRQMNVPFIMTASTESRAKRNIDILATPFGGMNNYHIFEKNPYGSLFPERDFVSDTLCYANNFLIVYTDYAETTIVQKVVSSTNCQDKSLTGVNETSMPKKLKCGIEKNCLKKCSTQSKVEKYKSGVKNKSNQRADNKKYVTKAQTEASNAQRKAENVEEKGKPKVTSKELLEKNLLLQEENKMLKENLQLQEKNDQLRKENLLLQKKLSNLKVGKECS